MKDRIKNGFNMLDKHVFQFDFLNDDFNALPQSLKNVIDDPEKRKRLLSTTAEQMLQRLFT